MNSEEINASRGMEIDDVLTLRAGNSLCTTLLPRTIDCTIGMYQ